MNRTFKIIARHPITKQQIKKRIYTSFEDYERYAHELIKRWNNIYTSINESTTWDVEIYELIDNKWIEINEVKCNCADLEAVAWRENKCKKCGQIWIYSKTIDPSGNYEFERDRKK